MNFIRKLNLSRQLLLVIMSVPIVLAIVLTIYSGIQVINSKNLSKKTLVETTSQSVLDKIDRNFYERFGDVQAFAYNKIGVEALKQDSATKDLQDFLNSMTSYYVLYDLMMVCTRDGKVLAVNSKDKTGKIINSDFLLKRNIAAEEWFKICTASKGPEGGAWYSDFTINPDVAIIDNDNDIGWRMAFAAPIKDENGVVIGVWYNFANWDEVTRGIRKDAEQSLQNPLSMIFITDKDGTIIDAKEPSLVKERKKISENNSFITLPRGKIFLDDYIIGHAQAKGAYTYKGKNWKAVTMLPADHLSIATFFSTEMIGLLIFVVTCLTSTLYLGIRFSKFISSKINNIKKVIEDLSTGKLACTDITGKDEIGEMAISVNTLTECLKEKVNFAEDIGKGTLDVEFKPASEDDVLGQSLLDMRYNLQLFAEADKKRNWATQGLATFSDILRTNTDLNNLCAKIIAALVKYIGANQGGIFLLRDIGKDQPYLELISGYAYDRQKYLTKRIEVGEGLLGQCILEGDYILLTEIPKNYIQITSGLGMATPTCILILPLKINNEIYGAIELASFSIIEEHQITFLQKVGENIASSIASVQVNNSTKSLLSEAQLMSEELRAQEEEMRQNMEELTATQEEMTRKETEYLQRIAELEMKVNNSLIVL
jgi:hypothetical protein